MTGASSVPVAIGARLRSRLGVSYLVLDQLGSGGNSDVYLCLDVSGANRGLVFAVKVFRRIDKEERLERFLEEIEVVRNIEHPAVMRVFDVGRWMDEGTGAKHPFVVTEYLPKTLRRVIRGNELRLAAKLLCALQLLSALKHLAGRQPQIIHRDIKPENIFIKGPSCVLGDFGLMKISADEDDDREMLKESVGPGMPRYYRTPDLVRYAKREAGICVKSDVFQLGLVFAELFFGRNPLKNSNDLLAPILLEDIVRPDVEFGGRLLELVQEMLETDKDKRPPAADLIDNWEGVFREVAKASRALEGYVFERP